MDDALRWTKSSYSGAGTSECVELALSHDGIAVRDSKVPHGPLIAFEAHTWAAFSTALRGDRLA
jgi:hypothetical protein